MRLAVKPCLFCTKHTGKVIKLKKEFIPVCRSCGRMLKGKDFTKLVFTKLVEIQKEEHKRAAKDKHIFHHPV